MVRLGSPSRRGRVGEGGWFDWALPPPQGEGRGGGWFAWVSLPRRGRVGVGDGSPGSPSPAGGGSGWGVVHLLQRVKALDTMTQCGVASYEKSVRSSTETLSTQEQWPR